MLEVLPPVLGPCCVVSLKDTVWTARSGCLFAHDPAVALRGTGMGLALCRSIVEAHGGRPWAEKNEPHSAKFIFTLAVKVKAAA